MTLNSLAWFIIKRGNRYGIRLRDYENPMIDSLSVIPCFETNENWRIIASFNPYPTPAKVMVQTIIGTEEEDIIPGELTFRLNGKKYTLYPFDAGDEFFIVFGDQTNGYDSYPGGRFLYTAGPDAHNQVVIDFNKAIILHVPLLPSQPVHFRYAGIFYLFLLRQVRKRCICSTINFKSLLTLMPYKWEGSCS